MIDRREAILARLKTVLVGIDSQWNVFRNKEDVPPELMPAFNLFDADEGSDDIGGRANVPTFGYGRIRMRPQIALYVSDSAPNIGSDLNGMRVKALAAIFADAALATSGSLGALLERPGAIFYDGASNQLAWQIGVTGQMILGLALLYPLLPPELSP